GTTTITNSMFDGNSTYAGGGGAIANGSEGLLNIVNCTFTENSAATSGGAIALLNDNVTLGQVSITHATFAGNTAGSLGGALYGQGAGIAIGSSIVSGSANCSGPIANG